jgi:TfoX/Sxy family transcriptional regulator of competence genes
MAMSQATEVLVDRVRKALDKYPVASKHMFGGLTFLLSGNMLCCVSDKGLMARVGAEAEPAALRRPYAAPCLGAGRRMAGFILVEHEGVERQADLAAWLDMSLAYVGKLPPKKPKPMSRRGRDSQARLGRR